MEKIINNVKYYIDDSNKKRFYFYSELSKLIEGYYCSDEEVNDLIYLLYYLCNGADEIEPRSKETDYDCSTLPDRQVDENTFIRNVWVCDLRVYCVLGTIQEEGIWQVKDALSEITEKIYFKLDKIVHPDYRHGLDYKEVRYYTEVEYIDKEEQEEMKKNHNMDFKADEWKELN